MLTQEPIQDQDTIKQKREVGNLAWRNPEDRNTDTQTDTEMHARYTDTSKRKKMLLIHPDVRRHHKSGGLLG